MSGVLVTGQTESWHSRKAFPAIVMKALRRLDGKLPPAIPQKIGEQDSQGIALIKDNLCWHSSQMESG